jgi:kynurenine formamidase
MRVLDLTFPLDVNTLIYREPYGYQDPEFVTEVWATRDEQGYVVHRLGMGTHTGTHFDAPAHFHVGGRTVDQVSGAELVGHAVVIDVRPLPRVVEADLAKYADRVREGGLALFLAPDFGVPLSTGTVAAVASWCPRLILYCGQFIDEGGRYHHNRIWLGADIPLVTDLNPETVIQVRDGDLLIVAPLPLTGLDGSPCRVFALQD